MKLFLFTLLAIIAISCTQKQEDEGAQQSTELSEEEKEHFMTVGKEIAGKSFEALSGNLMAAMQRGGVEEALHFCHIQALPLTDSLSKAHQAIIKRTTLKTRNPQNKPTDKEAEILGQYQKSSEQGETLQPNVHLLAQGEVLFTAPILVNTQCLKCHGKIGENTLESDYQTIKSLYPEDQAIGYEAGGFRGIWSIRFQRN